MKIKVTLTYITGIILAAMLVVSCSDNGNGGSDTQAPQISSPGSQNAVQGDTLELTFGVTVNGGFSSASIVSSSNGDATITSSPSARAESGDVLVQYVATSNGTGTVELEVTDQDGLSNNATVAITVSNTVQVNDNITSDQRWKDGLTYVLGGRIAVEAGVTLTIEGGAVIKGEAGTGANASALLVARDATINANGTETAPIIFTSVADEITPEDVDAGNFGSPNLDPDIQGLWGGVIVLGNAPISAQNENDMDVNELQIEGIPSSDTNGLYGGNDAADNSGTITYITIRHGGSNIGEGNEINGLTLGGVGNTTTINHIEVVANQDDGVEFFGGTVNVTDVLVWNNGDDGIDTDQAWSGTISNIVIVNPGESGFELDGPEGSFTSSGHTIQDATVWMGGENGTSEELFDVDASTDVNMSNILFFGLRTDMGSVLNVVSSDYPDYDSNTDGYAVTSLEAVIPSGFAVADFFTGGSASVTTEVADLSSASVGATDISQFAFTWARTSGALDSIGL